MNLRFYNGKILTGGAESPFLLTEGELHVRGSRIVRIGSAATEPEPAFWDRRSGDPGLKKRAYAFRNDVSAFESRRYAA